jgi:hypothetical protein
VPVVEIKVNEDEWNALSEDVRTQITEILRANGLLEPEENVLPDPTVSPSIPKERKEETDALKGKSIDEES